MCLTYSILMKNDIFHSFNERINKCVAMKRFNRNSLCSPLSQAQIIICSPRDLYAYKWIDFYKLICLEIYVSLNVQLRSLHSSILRVHQGRHMLYFFILFLPIKFHFVFTDSTFFFLNVIERMILLFHFYRQRQT